MNTPARTATLILLMVSGGLCGCWQDGDTTSMPAVGIRTLNRHNEESAIEAYLKSKAVSSKGANTVERCGVYVDVIDVEVTGERRLVDAVTVTANITAIAEPQTARANGTPLGCVSAPGGADRNQSTTVTGEQFRFQQGPDGWRIAGR